MDRSAASAYVYAKAGGMLAKSFVGTRATMLFSVKSLRELYTLLFDDAVPAIPEVLLAKEVENRAERQFLSDYISLIKNYSHPSPILIALLRFYDYDNLKEIGTALSLGEKNIPVIADVQDFSVLNYKAWPNIQKITENSPVSWYNKVPAITEQQNFDTRLDAQYIHELWNAVSRLSADDRKIAETVVGKEISVRNILWVLRLKVFYKMKGEDIVEKLAFASEKHTKRDNFAGEALKILDKEVDSWDAWKDWKYSQHLNPHEEGVIWELDPTWVEKSFNREIVSHFMRLFHKNPMSVMSLVAWFKIKQNELDCIRTVAEGLRLDVESDKMMDVAGIEKSIASR